MRVLINAISAKQGGILTYTANLMRDLPARGIETVFAVAPGFPAPAGTKVIEVEASGYSLLGRALWEQTAWRRLVAQVKPDVLFSSANYALLNSPVPQVLLVREGGLFDPFYLVNVAPSMGPKAALVRGLRRHAISLSIRHSDLVLTPTAAMRDLLAQWNPSVAERIQVNSYGTPSQMFTPAGQPRPWRHDGVLRLLYVSVYYPHKNPSDLLIAADRLNQAGMATQVRLTMERESIAKLSGSGLDLAYVDKASRAGQLELGTAPYETLPRMYQTNDVFVFPSVNETFGHPMVEAMGSGIPLVAADVAVNREVCGDAALYYTPFNPGHLADCLRRLDSNPDLRAEMVRRGRLRVTGMFEWRDHVDRLQAAFHRLAGGKGALCAASPD